MSWSVNNEIFDRLTLCLGFFALALLCGCNSVEKNIVPEPLVCLQEGGKSPFDTILITFKAGENQERPVEISYGSDYRSATYVSTDEKHFINMPKNSVWLECYITIYRLSGFAKHVCIGANDDETKLAKDSSYELSCEKTERKF